jgi:anti-sigma factor RsiW
MRHKEFEELVSAYIDFEVTPEEEKIIREHLGVCPSCRNLYEQEKIIKEKLYGLNEIISVVPDLNEKLIRSLEHVKGRRVISNLFLGVATSLAVVFVLVLFIEHYIFKTEPNPLLNGVLENYRDISKEKLPIAYKTENTKALQTYLDKTGNIPFKLDVDDFSKMGYKLKGGFVKEIANRRSAIIVYEGKELVGYYMMISSESDFPKEAKKIRNEEKAIDFYLLRREGYNLVMWKEKNTTCVMVSKLDEKQLLSLAIASVED